MSNAGHIAFLPGLSVLVQKVKAVHAEDMDVVVEPGVDWISLNEYLAPYGLFFPLDPGPGATIGGMCATRCSGSLAVRYGTMRDNVIALKVRESGKWHCKSNELHQENVTADPLICADDFLTKSGGLSYMGAQGVLRKNCLRCSSPDFQEVCCLLHEREGGRAASWSAGSQRLMASETPRPLQVVMPNGEVVKTASRARKSAAGYDLTRLMIGSEGTLGVITEITLRVQNIPRFSAVAMCSFPTVRDAAKAATDTMHSGVQVGQGEWILCGPHRFCFPLFVL